MILKIPADRSCQKTIRCSVTNIPLQLARELALQRYTRVLQEQGGREAYQQQLTDYLTSAPEGTRSEFPPEHIWALEQLGIELPPDSYEVLP